MYVGPKLYVAKATPLFDDSEGSDSEYGSTVLHLDMADALNLMLFAAKCSDGTPGYALWQVFSPRDTTILREFLLQEGNFDGAGNIIHSHQVYVTCDMLDRLYSQHGVRPYTIHQHEREVVYIPAGCAHQVRSLASLSTKFLSIECSAGQQQGGCDKNSM